MESDGCRRVCFYTQLGSNIWKLVLLFRFNLLDVPDGEGFTVPERFQRVFGKLSVTEHKVDIVLFGSL